MPLSPDAQQQAIETAIRAFDYSDYGMDDVSYALEADPDAQEWVPDLARTIRAALDPTAAP